MDLRTYQRRASTTSQLDLKKPIDAIAATFGLTHEAGTISDIYKKHLRDSIDLHVYKDSLKTALGDLLWYTSAVATAFGLDLQSIAENNLQRTSGRYNTLDPTKLSSFDADYPSIERFPRSLVFQFRDKDLPDGNLTAELYLIDAHPNPFPDGPITPDHGKPTGFHIGYQLGDTLTDNSARTDGYRFHDAIHLAFMAVLGWSPVTRRILHVKRRSRPDIDRNEDGARAAYAEEGLAHALACMAETRQYFRDDRNVDGDTLAVISYITRDLEVGALPQWLWTQAIVQGFQAMAKLRTNRGGYLTADLDGRRLTYETQLPSPTQRIPEL